MPLTTDNGLCIDDELSEATCMLADQVNSLIDEESVHGPDVLLRVEEALSSRILEHILMAESLLRVLREKRMISRNAQPRKR